MGDGEEQAPASGEALGVLQDPLRALQPHPRVDDESGALSDHDPHVGHQRHPPVRDHEDSLCDLDRIPGDHGRRGFSPWLYLLGHRRSSVGWLDARLSRGIPLLDINGGALMR